jgi:hypothetical protein
MEDLQDKEAFTPCMRGWVETVASKIVYRCCLLLAWGDGSCHDLLNNHERDRLPLAWGDGSPEQRHRGLAVKVYPLHEGMGRSIGFTKTMFYIVYPLHEGMGRYHYALLYMVFQFTPRMRGWFMVNAFDSQSNGCLLLAWGDGSRDAETSRFQKVPPCIRGWFDLLASLAPVFRAFTPRMRGWVVSKKSKSGSSTRLPLA